MAKTKTKYEVTEEFREAARQFMNGLWADHHRRDLFSGVLHTVWEDYKRTGEYTRLARRLGEAARRNGRHP